jgi:antitoxin VapB
MFVEFVIAVQIGAGGAKHQESLRERLERARGRGRAATVARRLAPLSDEHRGLRVVDDRSAGSVLGYDEHGLPR